MSHVLLHFADRVRYVESIRPMLLSLAKNYGTPLSIVLKMPSCMRILTFKFSMQLRVIHIQDCFALSWKPEAASMYRVKGNLN